MPYNTVTLLRDANGNPIPQYYNPVLDQMEALEGFNGANSFHEQGTIIRDIWSGSANVTKTFDAPVQTFSIVNDGDADITVNIHDFSFVIKSTESFEGKFSPFSTITITTTSAYRAYVKE